MEIINVKKGLVLYNCRDLNVDSRNAEDYMPNYELRFLYPQTCVRISVVEMQQLYFFLRIWREEGK